MSKGKKELLKLINVLKPCHCKIASVIKNFLLQNNDNQSNNWKLNSDEPFFQNFQRTAMHQLVPEYHHLRHRSNYIKSIQFDDQ